MSDEARYGIQELAALGGVSRRTVRYYVEEGLLPPPLGLGRGDHYTQDHLVRLLEVRSLQEQGLTIAQIRAGLAGPPAAPAPLEAPAREAWVRLVLMPGVELHVATSRRLPPASRLLELADWCRDHIPPSEEPHP
jgi:DNA-binding transcriptional MerR regulator